MTAEESAIEYFADQPYYDTMVDAIARKAVKYAHAYLVYHKTLGAGTEIDCMVRESVFKTIKKLERIE